MNLIVVGGTVVDVIFRGLRRLPTWPEHTEFTATNLVRPTDAPLVTLGGNGANAAYVAAVCGANVTLHTALGADAMGGLARGWLESAGCRMRVADRGTATAINVTAADARHRRATLFFPGAAVALPQLAATTRGLGAVLVCGWPHPPLRAVAREFAALRARGVRTAFDPGPLLDAPPALAAHRLLLKQLDLLVLNAHELSVLTRAPDLATSLKRLREFHAGDVVVKRGSDGALWLPAGARDPKEAREFRSRAVRVVNTVGAGDTFNGALLAALVRGASLPNAIRAGNRIAAQVVASGRGVLGARR
jgi:ribokinase